MTQRLDARLDTYSSPALGIFRIVIGLLFARLAALVGAGEMAFAYFTQHLPKGIWPLQNGGEPAVLFCFSFLLIAFAGAGALALQKQRN